MILFVHNPNTGGTAYATELRCRGMLANPGVDGNHLTAREWKMYNPQLWNNSERVAFVRNPWDRLVAIWARERRKHFSNMPFTKWLVEPTRHSLHSFDFRRISQYDFLKSENESLELSVKKFETDLKDIPPYHYLNGIEEGLSPERAHYSTFYNDISFQFVNIFFKKDIELWEYYFEDRRSY